MSDHSEILPLYRRLREAAFHFNNRLVQKIPKTTMDESARILGLMSHGIINFESESEIAVLADYCVYYPDSAGRNLATETWENLPPPIGSDERTILEAMTHAYYSIFEILEVERGVGVSVQDRLRGGTDFIADVGIGTSSQRGLLLATRVLPLGRFLMTGGAGLILDQPTFTRVSQDLARAGFNPETFDFSQITPQQEAGVAALVIRRIRAAGLSSRVGYTDPGSPGVPSAIGSERRRRTGRNDPCPCGSGRKYKKCCGRAEA